MEAEAERLAEEAEREARQQAERDARVRDRYVARIRSRVQRNWRIPSIDKVDPRAAVRVRLSPEGRVLSVEVAESSGDEQFDQSLERAVLRASPLPVPEERDLFDTYFREFNIVFQPDTG